MALYGRVGTDGKVHRISSAMFENGSANGHAFCMAEGQVILAEGNVTNCKDCRDKELQYEFERMALKKEKTSGRNKQAHDPGKGALHPL